MIKRKAIFLLACLFLPAAAAKAQIWPWFNWTLLTPAQFDEIVGEASGDSAWKTIMEIGGYAKDRPAEEFKDLFYEVKYVLSQLKKYGIPGAEVVKYPGGQSWKGIMGELWEVSPMRQKLASYQDMAAMLASGSTNADVKAELIWVGRGTKEELQGKDAKGKIVVAEGNISAVHGLACVQMGAEGVIAISTSRNTFDPLQIPWSGITGRGETQGPAKFGFWLPFREGYYLKERLLRGDKITVHARVKSQTLPYELQDVTAHIPGSDPNAGEIVFSAHMFEGLIKQSGNDNSSGCAGILEVARTLNTLINEGRLPKPRRTIRFIWGPEFSGIGPWVKANKDIMERTLCNINFDMVGEWLSRNYSFMSLMRTTYGNPHYINDVVENYFRYVGETNREKLQNRGNFPYRMSRRIIAPTGADEPFYYAIETHYGASDHEVFNDWGVQVPGIMMIAWPDQWYHTSGDHVDKSDPTALKRVVTIAAAAAYTIANADDDMAVKIASETMSNAARRLAHNMARGLEEMNNADAKTFAEAYAAARAYIEAGLVNEKATLDTVMELGVNKAKLGAHVAAMKKSVEAVGQADLAVLDAHMRAVAGRLNIQPVKLMLTELEKKAAKIVPRPTVKVKENGYQGYRDLINKVPEDVRKKYTPESREIDTAELPRLIDGKNSVLDIKKMLDAQSARKSDLEKILNYIEILKLAGLVEVPAAK